MDASKLTLGVVGTALKDSERRAPIHPDHFAQIPAALRKRIYVERGYGVRFGTSDEELSPLVAGVLDRQALFDRCDIMLIPKPVKADFPFFRDGQVLWGWPHLVQGPAMTQMAIDKRLSVIAWEAMNLWRGGVWQLHVFQKNNEIAGYASVMHALSLSGITGHYGRRRKACVINFGSTGRGAIHGLKGLGFTDVTLLTVQPGQDLFAPAPGVKHQRFQRVAPGSDRAEVVGADGTTTSMAKFLGQFDVVVNCILQDTDAPYQFVPQDAVGELRPGTLVVDVSCDEGMGFAFARPTSFSSPCFTVGDRITYYAVDHTPSYLWGAATWEISTALVPYLPIVMAGPAAWQDNETIRRALEMHEGVIINDKILNFQGRVPDYPHPRR